MLSKAGWLSKGGAAWLLVAGVICTGEMHMVEIHTAEVRMGEMRMGEMRMEEIRTRDRALVVDSVGALAVEEALRIRVWE
jgi:hypothetical protein